MKELQPRSEYYVLLTNTLGKLAPVQELELLTEGPASPGFCFSFYRADVDTFSRITEALRACQGVTKWRMFVATGKLCVAALDDEPTFYPPLTQGFDTRSVMTTPSSAAPLWEIVTLCAHLESFLKLKDLPVKTVEEVDAEDAVTLRDFEEPGMNDVWLMPEPSWSANNASGMPDGARRLHFGLKYDEWDAIVRALSVEPDWARRYPLLARIGREGAEFTRAEVGGVRDECLSALPLTSGAAARRGLQKLLMITEWARTTSNGILFLEE